MTEKNRFVAFEQDDSYTPPAKDRAPSKKVSRTQEQRNALAIKSMCHAALELFALKGYHATTLSDIGLRAGYSRGLAHHYFGNKDALAELLLDELGQRDTYMQILQLPSSASGADAWQRIETHMESSWQNFCDLHFEHAGDLAERGALVLRTAATQSPEASLRNKVMTIGTQLTALVENALRLCAQDGIIRADTELRTVALFYISAIAGMAQALQANMIEKETASDLIEPLRTFLHSLKTT